MHAECRDAIKDSDLIQMRYRGCAKNIGVPAPKLWQRSPKNKSQIQAEAAPFPANQPACPQVEAQTGLPALLSNDEWSRQFLLLVNGTSDYENSAHDIDHGLTTQAMTLESPHKESGRKRALSPSPIGDNNMSSTAQIP
jgi:hypothetical protein